MDPGKRVEPDGGVVNLSRAEAKQAWLAEGSDLERAARQALRERLAKVRDTPLCLTQEREPAGSGFKGYLTWQDSPNRQ